MIATLFAAALGAAILEVPKYYFLTTLGISTEGSIIALEADKHGSVVYGYKTTSRDSYEGSGLAGDINARFDDLQLAQKVRVYYDPWAEGVSCLGEPGKHLSTMLRGNAFIASFPSLFLLVMKIRRSLGLSPPIIRMRERRQADEIDG
jgi:hypothetical protein